MFQNLRIQKRLTVSFIMVSIVASIAGIVGAVAMFYIAARYDYSLKNYGFSQGDIGKAMTAFSEARSATRAIIGFTDLDAIDKALSMHDEKKAACEEYMTAIAPTLTTPEEQAEYDGAKAAMERFWVVDAEVIALGNTLDAALSKEAQIMSVTDLEPIYNEAYSYMENLLNVNVTTGNELADSLAVLRIVLLLVIAGVIAGAIVISMVLGGNIAKGIAGPLNRLSERLKSFAEGNLSEEFPKSEAKDEVADMVAVAAGMAENLTVIISDAKHRLGEMAKGNYALESTMADRYLGEFSELDTAIHEMNANMNDTLHQIEDASAQVSAGSGNLAEASQNLAEGATDQAGAVEELLATISTLTEGINRTSGEIGEAYELSSRYAGRANDSKQQMQELVNTMERIAETSRKIESIIADIEEIASQTNLLSLNASIEAARAGDAGRGFAVVAGQIGKLADESAQSAVNTRELIMSSISEVTNGTQAVSATADTIEDVVNGINQVAVTSKEISERTQLQAESMKQAEEGIHQISEVVQANSATAEEASATSEELSAQATTLDSLVKRFQLKPLGR